MPSDKDLELAAQSSAGYGSGVAAEYYAQVTFGSRSLTNA